MEFDKSSYHVVERKYDNDKLSIVLLYVVEEQNKPIFPKCCIFWITIYLILIKLRNTNLKNNAVPEKRLY